MLVSLGEIFLDSEDQHQALAAHATDNFATTIGPFDYRYQSFLDYEIPRTDWLVVSDGSLLLTTRDFRYSKERMEQPYMKALIWKFFFAGAEIISPILNESRWDAVAILLDCLELEPCSVLHNTSTSTHIHVGIQVPKDVPLSRMQVGDDCTRVAAVWYLFETFILQIHPEHRVNEYCRRTRRTPLARACNQREFIQRLYEVENPMSINRIMNNNRVTYRQNQETIISSRFFGASFDNLDSDTKFTIEFRSHEGTKDIDAIECWGKLVMRLFDQAVQCDWEYIRSLVDLTDALQDQSCYGPEQTRPVMEWRRWTQHMHYLFVNFLAGQQMRDEYLHPNNPGSLEEAILRIEQLADESSADPQLRNKRAEELLIKRLAIYMSNRRAKFKDLHEARFSNFMRWDSEARRDPHPNDYMDFPNPSGIVQDVGWRDVPINDRSPRPDEVVEARAIRPGVPLAR